MTALPTTIAASRSPSLVSRLATKFGVDPDKMLGTLKATAFRQDSGDVSNEQLMALLVVAEQYNLNPWTRELYAFSDPRKGIVPIVSIDGWIRIVNEHEQFNGAEFLEADDGAWCEVVMHRRDREHPVRVREWLSECKRNTQPWNQWPRRMLRHKAFIQCARVAFGFAGIYDPDEGERILETTNVVATVAPGSRTDQAKAALRAAAPAPVQPEPAEPEPQASAEPPPADVDPSTGEVVPHYDAAAAIAAVNACETPADLNKLWPSIVLDFQQTGRELPVEVEGAFSDRKEALAAKAQKRSRS